MTNLSESSNSVFIPGNVPSSKNSNQISKNGLFKSATVRKYLQKAGVAKYSSGRKQYTNYKTPGRINYYERMLPVYTRIAKTSSPYVGFFFVRDSNRSFDYHNVIQLVADLMTSHGWIVDDSISYFVPVFLGYRVDRNNPGVYILPLDYDYVDKIQQYLDKLN